MTVKELISYLQTQDQDAVCQYLEVDDWGRSTWKELEKYSLYYIDFRGNEFIKPNQPHENKRYLQFGY